jgi:hypothetical protein
MAAPGGHHHHTDLARIASSLRANLIFRKDRGDAGPDGGSAAASVGDDPDRYGDRGHEVELRRRMIALGVSISSLSDRRDRGAGTKRTR